jgi:L-ribulose-5-phosphate 4-epimerase
VFSTARPAPRRTRPPTWSCTAPSRACFGTTHADHFNGPVPVTRLLTDEEIGEAYERNTGRVIVERFAAGGIDPAEVPACLDAGHGPFAWGATPEEALDNAIALEHVAAMALHTLRLAPAIESLQGRLLAKHFQRKHGPAAYYGQRVEGTAARSRHPGDR